MTKRKRLGVLLFCAVAIVAMILLATGLSDLELQPGRPLPRFEDIEEMEALPLPWFLDSEMARYIVLLVNLVAILLIPASIVCLIVSPKARRRALAMLTLMLCLVALFLLYRNKPESEPPAQSQLPLTMPLEQVEAPVVNFVANPPQWAVLMTATGMAALIAAGLVGVVWLLLERGRRSERPLDQLAERAEDAMEALQAGADLKDAVMHCYLEMCRVLREQQGIRRDASMTAREFERYLAQEGLPQAHVGRLTQLFEMVRYGTKAMGKREELEAMDCLAAIIEVCRSLP
jgi:hypothetical protein